MAGTPVSHEERIRNTYAAARALLHQARSLADRARSGPVGALESGTKGAFDFAWGLIAWAQLRYWMDETVLLAARAVSPPGSPTVILNPKRPRESYLEAIALDLGPYLRSSVYSSGRSSPLDPDTATILRLSMKKEPAKALEWAGAMAEQDRERIVKETSARQVMDAVRGDWEAQTPDAAKERAMRLRFNGIDFDHLLVQLNREEAAVVQLVPRAGERAGGTEDEVDEDLEVPLLSRIERLVLIAVHRFHGTVGLTIEQIIDNIDDPEPPSDKPVREAVNRLIELGLAERPGGKYGGARLTTRGRRLATKISA